MRTTSSLAVLLLVLAAPLMAGAVSDTYVIPAAGHTRGAGGELWQTDTYLFNPGAVPVNVDLLFVDATGSSRAAGTTVTLLPGSATVLRDIVGDAGGQGALLVSGSQPFVIGSRAYAATTRGTFGASVEAASEFIDESSGDAFLTGLASTAANRTNVGVFAAADADQPMKVTISVLDANGVTAGSRTIAIPAGTINTTQFPLASIVPGLIDVASARVRIISGRGVATAYASVIDNATSDSSFIAASSGVLPPTAAAARLRRHVQ